MSLPGPGYNILNTFHLGTFHSFFNELISHSSQKEHSGDASSEKVETKGKQNDSSINQNQTTVYQNKSLVSPSLPSHYNKIAQAANSALVYTPSIDRLSTADLIIRFKIQMQLLKGEIAGAQYGSYLREAEQVLLMLKEREESYPSDLRNELIQLESQFQIAFRNSPNGPSALTQRDVNQLQHFTHVPDNIICTHHSGDEFKKSSISIAGLDSHFRSLGYSNIMHSRGESDFEGITGISDVFMLGKERYSGYFQLSTDTSHETLMGEITGINNYFKEKASQLGYEGFVPILIKELADKEKAKRLIEQGFQICTILLYPKVTHELENSGNSGDSLSNRPLQIASNQAKIGSLQNHSPSNLQNEIIKIKSEFSDPLQLLYNNTNAFTPLTIDFKINDPKNQIIFNTLPAIASSSAISIQDNNIRVNCSGNKFIKPPTLSINTLSSAFDELGYPEIKIIHERRIKIKGISRICDVILIPGKIHSLLPSLKEHNLKNEQIEIHNHFKNEAKKLGYQSVHSKLIKEVKNKIEREKFIKQGFEIYVYCIYPQLT